MTRGEGPYLTADRLYDAAVCLCRAAVHPKPGLVSISVAVVPLRLLDELEERIHELAIEIELARVEDAVEDGG